MEIHTEQTNALLDATIPPPPEYLDLSEENGDRLLEKTQNAVGKGYIAAVLAGGVYGSLESFFTGPSGSLKLRFYGMMSGFSRRGLKLANATSVVLVNPKPEDDIHNSVMSGALTGALYKSTAGVRPMALAAGIGAIMAFGVQSYSKGFEKASKDLIKLD